MQDSLTIERTIHLYLTDRADYYDTGEGPSRELDNLASGLRLFLESILSRPLCSLDGPMLARLRNDTARAGELARSTINKRIGYVRRMIKWCVEHGLARPEQRVSIESVELIRRGRYGARERAPIESADLDAVARVLEDLTPVLSSMMRMIQLTGMRPGEARIMQASDLSIIEHDGIKAFRYEPSRHKTMHLGKRRRIYLVGEAKMIAELRISTLIGSSLFDSDSRGYLFSVDGSGDRPFATNSVHQAVRRSCDRLGVERWTPNQLRHAYATRAKRDGHQLELIQGVLGHSDPRTTGIYIDDDADDQRIFAHAVRFAGLN